MKFKQFGAIPCRTRDRDVEIVLITTRKSVAGLCRRVGPSSTATSKL
jgi:hypothetical protein